MSKSCFMSKETFIKAFSERLEATYLKKVNASSIRERFNVLGTLIREHIAKDWIATNQLLISGEQRAVHYFSIEFLLGRLITNNLMNLGIRNVVEDAFNELKIDLNEVEDYESDPGLGNGGLGRLAACFLDSMASLALPGFGHCLRYRYGLFRQKIKNGYQEERPDNWLSDGYVWEIRKEEEAEDIPFCGHVEYNGKMQYHPSEYIRAVPYDVPIVGDQNQIVNYLRLWNAEPARKYPKHLSPFAYHEELEQISGFLYPDDTTDAGKRLRLMQQYFFTSAGVKSICRKEKEKYGSLNKLDEHVVIHINDTHPTLVIPELIRILLDEEGMEWDEAWKIVQNAVCYTNHTILSEALEQWSIALFEPLLPRIYQLIEEINRRFLLALESGIGKTNPALVRKLAIINDGKIKMAHLCIVASYSVNGVAKIHTEILKTIEMKDFHELYPGKFHNVTNGITHRRWLIHANQELSSLIDSKIGPSWRKDPAQLSLIEAHADDKDLQKAFLSVKRKKKLALAKRIACEQGLSIDPDSLFDIQVKRLHEYKRQLLNALHIMYIYDRLLTDPLFRAQYVPHTFIFGAKAAATYYFAKKVIKLINTIQNQINNDQRTNSYLKVVFVENYNVSYAEVIMPSCDLSEQISTASKEASGTGNMKFMMNGAITIGTEDGANIEIHELVGDMNIFTFGMSAAEVTALSSQGTYLPESIYNQDPLIKKVLDMLVSGFFKDVDKEEFREIHDKLRYEDRFFVLKDFHAYRKAHEQANNAFKNQSEWAKAALINIAKSGGFASDRSIQEYAQHIWHLKPYLKKEVK